MRDLFDVAKAHRDLPLDAVDELVDHPASEPRLVACCILDFTGRTRLTDDRRRELYRLHLRRHDRITAWGMVDRAAPRIVGGYLAPIRGRCCPLATRRRSGQRRCPADSPSSRMAASGSPGTTEERGAAANTPAVPPPGFPPERRVLGDHIWLAHGDERGRGVRR